MGSSATPDLPSTPSDSTIDGATATTLTALGYMARGLLWVVILLVALATVGINVTALVTGLGVGGVAIALAVQNILGDLFGALSIVLDKPFVVGDSIQVDQLNGTVEKIDSAPSRSPSTFWTARAIATPPIPSPVTSAVTFTPKVPSTARRMNAQSRARAT